MFPGRRGQGLGVTFFCYFLACSLCCVATKLSGLPTNISYNMQGELDELPLDMSNNMNQSDGNIKSRALSPN
ncbi:hypothetical protein DSO57_1010335 [Entomophthora muscae]|uniref:Uncharacterized protein n=1 Tax=Entomophthora muscae TaxID=34485 RepID=A0ACC2TH55_9FUNG|nr:hypothetical protein DSO57_1010335 [Entomophthora muscae]